MAVNPTSATTSNMGPSGGARDLVDGRATRPAGDLAVPALCCDAVPTRPFERLWLSACELRMVADEVGPTVVVVADLPVGLADMVKARRRRLAAGYAWRNGQPR